MFVEIVDKSGNVLGAVNTDCCDLIRIDPQDPRKAEGGALMRSYVQGAEDGKPEVYKTRVSYLRLIEVITQSEIKAVQHIAELVKDDKAKDAPRLVMP